MQYSQPRPRSLKVRGFFFYKEYSNKMEPIFQPKSRKQEMMIEAFLQADVTVIGGAAGSGKSFILQGLPLFLIDDPHTDCIMFRRKTPQITGQGGIWPTAKSIYNQLPESVRPKVREGNTLEFEFPNGAKIKHKHMEHVKNKLDIQGLQFTFIGVDEACQFEWEQLEYMMSRLRSRSHYKSRMVMSCNPDPDHEIRRLIDWYLDEKGYPIEERAGKLRYFIRRNGEFIWGDSKEDLKNKYGKKCRPLSFTFVNANVYDNPLISDDYIGWLEGLNDVDKAQLLYGCWDARAKGASYFQREWVRPEDHTKLPAGAKRCARGYDLAAEERSQVNKHPDFTTSIKMYQFHGLYYIVGDYHPEFYDEETNCHGRLCAHPGFRNLKIAEQGASDGKNCVIVLPIDPAAAGKQVYQDMAFKFGRMGFLVKKDPAPNNQDKLKRFIPFATAAENGLVRIVTDSFDPVTLEIYLKELEAFDNSKSTATRKDDFVDCTASVYNYLNSSHEYGAVVLPDTHSPTKYAAMRRQLNKR